MAKSDPPLARLTAWREDDGLITFNVSRRADRVGLEQALAQQVAEATLVRLPGHRGWQVPARYAYVIAPLFANAEQMQRDDRNRRRRIQEQAIRRDVRRARAPLRRLGILLFLLLTLAVGARWAVGNQTAFVPVELQTTDGAASVQVSAVVESNANLRTGPGLDYAVVDGVLAGQFLNLTGTATAADGSLWYRLTNGLWIYSDLVTLSAAGLPQVTAPPPELANQSADSADATVPSTGSGENAQRTPATVRHILDGDTIIVVPTGGNEELRVRYIGMDTPELGEPFHDAATQRNRILLADGLVFLARDRSETDRYGRLLRYVYLPDGRMVNELLVAEGLAVVLTIEPDVKYAPQLRAAEADASAARVGLWGQEKKK